MMNCNPLTGLDSCRSLTASEAPVPYDITSLGGAGHAFRALLFLVTPWQWASTLKKE